MLRSVASQAQRQDFKFVSLVHRRPDLNQVEDLKQLNELRRIAMSVWIIVLCDLQAESKLLPARRQGVDAVLSAPFSMLDLTSRLAAFSIRARPGF